MELAQLIRTKRPQKPGAAETLDILFAAAQVRPYSEDGPMADVAANLPKALSTLGHRVSIITPLYKHLDPGELHLSRRLQPLQVPRLGKVRKKVEATIYEGRTPNGVRIFFIEQPDFFANEDEETGELSAEQEVARFAFFSRAVVEFALQYSTPVDVIHCNDWQSALAPIFRDYYYAEEMSEMPCVLTIHDLQSQGVFPREAISESGLPKRFERADELGQDKSINFLKGGIRHATRLSTVSPTYAEQIQSAEAGFGLDAELRDAEEKLTGILNGADYSIWSPDVDHFIDLQYDLSDLNAKRKNKTALQREFGLPERPTLPLLAFKGPLTPERGIELVLPAVENLLASYEHERDSFQMIFVADGDKKYVDQVRALAEKFPRHVAAHIGEGEELAHKLLAAADLFLLPTKFEPFGLIQLYAMKYGALPIVHATGGLLDTVCDPSRGDQEEGATGFVFEGFEAKSLEDTIARATTRYRHYRQWRPMIQNAMEADFSWESSAAQYIDLYNKALGREEPEA